MNFVMVFGRIASWRFPPKRNNSGLRNSVKGMGNLPDIAAGDEFTFSVLAVRVRLCLVVGNYLWIRLCFFV